MRPRFDRIEFNDDIELVAPRRSDMSEFLALVEASTELHAKWVHPPSDADAYGRYLVRIGTSGHRGFLAREISSEMIVGVVNVNDVVLGALRSASLGYYGFASRCGNGRMTTAVGLAVGYAFSELRLHRVEANIQPGNGPSPRSRAEARIQVGGSLSAISLCFGGLARPRTLGRVERGVVGPSPDR